MHRNKPPSDFIAHTESILHLDRQVKQYSGMSIWDAAARAVTEEIMTAPKPGLVDPLGQGCHCDMTWETFIKSAQAIEPFWRGQAYVGLSGTDPSEALTSLRRTGLKMEKSMSTATGGINTHKGLIFLLSLLVYGAGHCVYSGEEFTAENIVSRASEAAEGLVLNELAALHEIKRYKPLTNGEKLFLAHGITGARGEAEGGFPSVILHGLPEMRRVLSLGATPNNANIASLLAIMLSNEDSNVIHRGGHDFWKKDYRDMVKEASVKFDPTSEDYGPIEELEKEFLKTRTSPGGAADLLCCTIFLNMLTKPSCQQYKNDVSFSHTFIKEG